MSNFKVNQKVVCIKFYNLHIDTNKIIPAPLENEMVTINEIDIDGWLVFKEYPNDLAYEPWNFRPLHHEFAEEVISILLEQPETIEL